MELLVADVIILSNIPKPLSYAVPSGLSAKPGVRVAVPLRNSTAVGVIIDIRELRQSDKNLKDILYLVDEVPLIPSELIELIIWTARYYHAGIGSCMALAFPPYLRKPRIIEPDKTPVLYKPDINSSRISNHEKIHCSLEINYTPDQIKAIEEITRAIKEERFYSYVLHGITGSGKTEVYLATAMEALSYGRSVLYMVPEIALTPQTINMVKKRIPFEIAVFHSRLSPKNRAREFMKVTHNGVRFVLGTRSAIFSPLKDIGLIIVDEEHDHSYKQDDGIPYNARDLSLLRAKNNKAAVVLGSATPSMETFYRTKQSHSSLITMSSRIGTAALPEVEVIDMKSVKGPLSERLIEEISITLSKGEQALLFINRRGFSAAMVCPGCGKILTCRRCNRSLTYHKSKAKALCHWCGFTMALPEICPSCGCLDMKPVGMGTELIIQALEDSFKDKRILRIDSDEITTIKSLTTALDNIRDGRIDIIVGTQMIAKGHDFPLLTLVGVIHAEQMLYMPDFRSGERTFQQIVQVCGRAGRRKSGTKVIIQTLIPEHPLIESIARNDFYKMMDMEQEIRKATHFPPYCHIARCVITSKKESVAQEFSLDLASSIKIQGVETLGPAPAPITLIRERFRWHLILRSKNRTALHKAIDIIEQIHCPNEISLKVDVDPYSMM